MSYLSRLGLNYSIQSTGTDTTAQGPGLDTGTGIGSGLASRLGTSSAPTTTKGSLLVHVSVTVMVQSPGGGTRVGVLARGSERTKAKASEVACQRALTHLVTQVDTAETDTFRNPLG